MQKARPDQLFLLSPPNAGTTAMAQLLLQSPVFWSVTAHAEGQQHPAVRALMRADPWNPKTRFDWQHIREAWERGRPPGRVLLEKSPPNLLRAAEIDAAWPGSFFLISNRHPLAILASNLAKQPDAGIETIIGDWISRARIQRRNADMFAGRCLVTTYEQFVANPRRWLDQLSPIFGDLGIDADALLSVKHYSPDRVRDHNPRQIALLTASQIDMATRMLARRQDLLKFWDYRLDLRVQSSASAVQ